MKFGNIRLRHPAILFAVVVCYWFAVDRLHAAVPATGGEIQRIVIADQNDPVQAAAAKDLQRIFQAVTQGTIDIATEPGDGRQLFIGCAPEGADLQSQLATLDDQGIYVAITPEYIICTGTTPAGVYNAVQELLYQIGYRMIWPGR